MIISYQYVKRNGDVQHKIVKGHKQEEDMVRMK